MKFSVKLQKKDIQNKELTEVLKSLSYRETDDGREKLRIGSVDSLFRKGI